LIYLKYQIRVYTLHGFYKVIICNTDVRSEII